MNFSFFLHMPTAGTTSSSKPLLILSGKDYAVSAFNPSHSMSLILFKKNPSFTQTPTPFLALTLRDLAAEVLL